MGVLFGVFLVPGLNLVPNRSGEGAVYAEVDGGLRRRKTKVTLGLVWPAPMASMSAVRSFPCRAGQENNLHSGSAFAV
jgi:hypothetical protein